MGARADERARGAGWGTCVGDCHLLCKGRKGERDLVMGIGTR